MPNLAPQQSQSSNVSIVYVGYFAISLSRIATGLFKSFVMSSSAGVEDSLAQLPVNFQVVLHASPEAFAGKVEPEPMAQRVLGRSRDRGLPEKSLARKGYLCPVEFV